MWLEVTGVLLGAAGPIAGLLFEKIWLVAPATTGWAILTGPLAVIAAASLAFGFGRVPNQRAATAARAADGV